VLESNPPLRVVVRFRDSSIDHYMTHNAVDSDSNVPCNGKMSIDFRTTEH